MTGQLPLDLPRPDSGRVLALTVWRPWAEAFFRDGKDVENRPWSTPYRGPLVIHAGQTFDHDAEHLVAGGPDDHPAGVLLGVVDLTDCIRNSRSPWAAHGQWHWLVANPRRLVVPVRFRGRRGLFPVPSHLLKGVIDHG